MFQSFKNVVMPNTAKAQETLKGANFKQDKVYILLKNPLLQNMEQIPSIKTNKDIFIKNKAEFWIGAYNNDANNTKAGLLLYVNPLPGSLNRKTYFIYVRPDLLPVNLRYDENGRPINFKGSKIDDYNNYIRIKPLVQNQKYIIIENIPVTLFQDIPSRKEMSIYNDINTALKGDVKNLASQVINRATRVGSYKDKINSVTASPPVSVTASPSVSVSSKTPINGNSDSDSDIEAPRLPSKPTTGGKRKKTINKLKKSKKSKKNNKTQKRRRA
jgi:hypothetical protein